MRDGPTRVTNATIGFLGGRVRDDGAPALGR